MRKILAALLALCVILSIFTACSGQAQVEATVAAETSVPMETTVPPETTVPEEEALPAPKYVFLFIGDGMSYPQLQSAADYLGVLNREDTGEGTPPDKPKYLNFMNFEAAGSAVNYDASSFIPDSSSSATSIATGHKTSSGSLNMDVTGSVAFETIAEKVHKQLGMKVGIVSSVNLNHATPAAFYAHQPSRNNYYEIGLELAESGFEYFAGGGLKYVTGQDTEKPSEDLYMLARQAGYTVTFTNTEADAVTADTGKVILVDEHLEDTDSMVYEIDRREDMWSLARYVQKGIEVLDNEKGFFLMCEGGKIDWACHANDAATAVHDVIALADAVQVAIDFAAEHPEETLILVTGDHETGGMTIGFAGTDYSTYMSLLQSQKISYQKFDSDYVRSYKRNGTSFSKAMKDIEKLFGLKVKGEGSDRLVMTNYELEQLRTAYEKTVRGTDTGHSAREEQLLYGGYRPLTVTLTHILNNKAGISFSTYAHTGLPVAVFAQGLNAEMFNGYYDNTEIYGKLAAMLHVT